MRVVPHGRAFEPTVAFLRERLQPGDRLACLGPDLVLEGEGADDPGLGIANRPRLIALHNVHFLVALLREARGALAEMRFDTWSADWLERYPPSPQTDAEYRATEGEWVVKGWSGKAGQIALGKVDDATSGQDFPTPPPMSGRTSSAAGGPGRRAATSR